MRKISSSFFLEQEPIQTCFEFHLWKLSCLDLLVHTLHGIKKPEHHTDVMFWSTENRLLAILKYSFRDFLLRSLPHSNLFADLVPDR
jgi:hypothetical protein